MCKGEVKLYLACTQKRSGTSTCRDGNFCSRWARSESFIARFHGDSFCRSPDFFRHMNLKEDTPSPFPSLQHTHVDGAALKDVFEAGHGQNFSEMKLYGLLFNRFPNSFLETNMEVTQAIVWTKERYKAEIRADWAFRRELHSNILPEIDDNVLVLFEDLLLYFDVSQQKILFLYNATPETLVFKLVEQLRFKFKRKEKRGEPKLHFVQPGMSGLRTESIVLEHEALDLELNYNHDLQQTHQRIVGHFEDELATGLILLYGTPGTGKTTYLRHLITQTTRPVIYLPTDLATELGSPSMMRVWKEFPQSVCIIEDAERILTHRGENANSPVASLLNLTDGFLAQCFHILFVCTFNTTLSALDPALIRKGRLLASYEFKALERAKAQALSDALGYDGLILEDTVLADIYHRNSDRFVAGKRQGVIGFIQHEN